MRRTAFLTLAAVLALAVTDAPAAGPKTFDEARAIAAEEDKPILVDFFATWCGPCKAFTREAAKDDQLQAALDGVVLFKTDAEKGEGRKLARSHRVRSYPTFLLVDAGGKPIDRWSGYRKDHFLWMLGAAMEKRARAEQAPEGSN